MTRSNGRRCVALTANWKPCQMKPLKGSRHCFSHSAQTVHQRRVASSRGGKRHRVLNAKAPVPARSITDLQGHLEQAIADAMMHPNSLQRSMVIARLVLASARMIEVGDVERRLELIERQLANMERAR